MSKYKQVSYSIIEAIYSGIHEYPSEQMKKLGFKVIAAVPQTIYESIWFTVEDYIDDMPSYISKFKYNYEYWHNGCWKECDYFKQNASCCHGGEHCLKS